MDIFLIVSIIFVPVPLFHLWLHALLGFWRRKPVLFYILCLFFWLFAFWFFIKIDAVFPLFLFYPSALLFLSGFALIILGLVFMALSILALGIKRFFVFAVLVPLSVKQKRINSGLFKIIPHPAYIGEILIIFGAFLASGKAYLAAAFIFIIALFPISIYFEEKELNQRV
ncbi:MAG: methyltransferase [Patescibacteria group bacterium]